MTSTPTEHQVAPVAGATDPDLADILQETLALYETADRFVREVGTFREDAVIPALNELRYAGHHVVQSIGAGGIVTDASQIRKARGHCERALYEASEAGIMVAGRAIVSVRKSYPGIVISEVVKDYSDFRLLAKKAQVQVDAGRADRESVLGQTQEFMDTYRHLREAVDVLDASRDDLEAKREINRKADRQFVLTLMTRISLGILAAAVALIVALWPQ